MRQNALVTVIIYLHGVFLGIYIVEKAATPENI